MEGGQANNLKVGAIIQARMSSSRLPGKTLMPLPLVGGKPILQWIINTIKTSSNCSTITVASSQDKSNDVLEEYCSTNNISIYRGSEEDVLSRFQEVINKEDLDVVIRLTADNPLLDAELLDLIINKHINEGHQYTKTVGLPLGMNFEIINADVLQYTGQEVTKQEREHVTLRAAQSSEVKKCVFNPIGRDLSEVRLTIDYAADYLTVSQLLQILLQTEECIDIRNIENVLNKHPWLIEANSGFLQKKQYYKVEDEIIAARQIMENLEMKHAAKLLKL